MREKLTRLAGELRVNAPLVIAYSGGVDSACLLALAHRELGGEVLGVIADSPSLPRRALAEALTGAAAFGVTVEVIRTQEFANPDYTANPLNRCYFCKAELFQRMEQLAQSRGYRAIAYGENADDPAADRPGSVAAREFRVLSPLRTAGLGKAEIRSLAREMGLAMADAPAQPCLSSRVATGVPVTPAAISKIEWAEDALRDLDFRILRVRYLDGGAARVQVAPEELPRLREMETRVRERLAPIGFSALEIDPLGYRGRIA